jgi:hypothetical protein
MNRKSIQVIFLLTLVFFLTTGGYISYAQMNLGKIKESTVGIVEEAQGKETQKLAEGMAQPTPEGAQPAQGAAAQPENEPTNLQQLNEDKLKDAIQTFAGSEAFAQGATKIVRSYIKKIKVAPRAYEQEFEAGAEPWVSKSSDLRYSPFDAMAGAATGIKIELKQAPPFLPPVKAIAKQAVDFTALKQLVRLKMTSKSGDKYIALVEIAGIPLELKEGDSRSIPEVGDIVVESITMDRVELRSGNQRVNISFLAPESTKGEGLQIEVKRPTG